MKRRQFTQCCSALAMAAGSGLAHAIEPFARPQPGRLQLSLSAYSLRKYLQGQGDQKADMDLFDFVDYCHELGVPGAELTSYYFPADITDDYLYRLKRHCHMRGVTISGGAIRNDFCSSDPVAIARDLEHTRQWVDHYAKLGAPAIRIFAGKEVDGEELSQTLKRCAVVSEEACRYAGERGILLALENHGGVTARAEGLLEIVRQVDSDAFGVNFDSGNFHSEDPYSELARIAPYAVNAQIKVEMKKGGQSEETDLARVVQILQDANYSGWVALEYEAAEEPRDAIPRWLEQLHELIYA